MKKQNVMVIPISMLMLCVLFIGCNRKEQQVPLSELMDWNKEKISESGYPEWAPALIQNHRYVFYENIDKEIIRVDKQSKKKIIIRKLKKLPDSTYDVGMALVYDTLYYMYDSCLYRCDVNGDNVRQLVSKRDLKRFVKGKNIQDTVDGVKFYNNDLYLIIGCDVLVRLHAETKEFEIIAKGIESGSFYKDNLYYIDATAIYKVNLKTLKRTLVRGKKWSKRFLKSDDTVYYQEVMNIKGKLYYTCYQGKWVSEGAAPSKLYLYKENGKDIKKYNASVTLFHSANDGSKIAYYDVHTAQNKSLLIIYDVDTGRERKMELPKNFYDIVQLEDDILLYRSDFETVSAIKI